ncbi:hypothetical protein GGX14DRAFT_571622 [Mycena pura]|uniref:Uncharacterized protein n=1 Tax=Mycena pura TaxID=153505 RepID=A0AAD6Y7Q2_9AGAR|nr:hypothetical protein GGX14DRAFT_571622 [Mycena pura]
MGGREQRDHRYARLLPARVSHGRQLLHSGVRNCACTSGREALVRLLRRPTNAFPYTDVARLWVDLYAAGVSGPFFDWMRMVYARMVWLQSASAGFPNWESGALAAAAGRSWFEAGGTELARGGGEGGREQALVYTAEDAGLRTTACLAEARRALRVPGAWAGGAMSTGCSRGGHGGSRRLGGSGKTIGDNADVPELVSVASVDLFAAGHAGWAGDIAILLRSLPTPILIVPSDFLSVAAIEAIMKKVVEAVDADLQFDINFLQKTHLPRNRLEFVEESEALMLFTRTVMQVLSWYC